MLAAISGSQGSGKSTIIKALQDRGMKCTTRKTSRSILTDWNVTLEDVNNDFDLTIKFQEEIIRRKFNDEQEAAHSQDLWFTERTYADLFTYALVTLGKDNRFSDWLREYYTSCMRLQQSYDLVYYLKAGKFTIEHDGVRGSSEHYSRMVDLVMSDFTNQMTHNSILTMIDTPNLDQRINIILLQTKGALQRTNKLETRNDGK
jgi:predicted ATPase